MGELSEALADRLEALHKAASQEADDVRYYGGPSSSYLPHANALANGLINALPDILAALRATRPDQPSIRGAVEALEAIRDGDVPRPVASPWRKDGKPSKHDLCQHGVEMYADCSNCTADFITTALAALRPDLDER